MVTTATMATIAVDVGGGDDGGYGDNNGDSDGGSGGNGNSNGGTMAVTVMAGDTDNNQLKGARQRKKQQ